MLKQQPGRGLNKREQLLHYTNHNKIQRIKKNASTFTLLKLSEVTVWLIHKPVPILTITVTSKGKNQPLSGSSHTATTHSVTVAYILK